MNEIFSSMPGIEVPQMPGEVGSLDYIIQKTKDFL